MSKILYKYLDINGAKMMLHYSNLMYANATTFNDPLDCHPSLINFSNVPPEECKVWPPYVIENISTNKFANFREFIWISCLSKVHNSTLMWSYYNKHEGVCIGLDMDKVKNYLQKGYLGFEASTEGKDVEYKEIINKPDYYKTAQEAYDYLVYTKAKEWAHEQEVRLYINKPSSKLFGTLPFQQNRNEFNHKELRAFVPIGSECFDSIFLGVKIGDIEKHEIITFARQLNPDIKIYQMEIDTKEFRLINKII